MLVSSLFVRLIRLNFMILLFYFLSFFFIFFCFLVVPFFITSVVSSPSSVLLPSSSSVFLSSSSVVSCPERYTRFSLYSLLGRCRCYGILPVVVVHTCTCIPSLSSDEFTQQQFTYSQMKCMQMYRYCNLTQNVLQHFVTAKENTLSKHLFHACRY